MDDIDKAKEDEGDEEGEWNDGNETDEAQGDIHLYDDEDDDDDQNYDKEDNENDADN